MNKSITILTGRLPPAVCGIGDYSLNLARLWQAEGYEVRFAVCDGLKESRKNLGSFTILPINIHGPLGTLRELESSPILIQWAYRLYDPHGLPWAFLRHLDHALASHPKLQASLFFHELWAACPLLSKRGLPELINQLLTRRLLRRVKHTITNTEEHAQRLRHLVPGLEVSVVPIFANIRPSQPVGKNKDSGSWVVFGLEGNRMATLRLHADSLPSLSDAGILASLTIAGRQAGNATERQFIDNLFRDKAVRISYAADLDTESLSQLFAKTQFGLTAQTALNFTKSTVFMTYLAHRIIPYAGRGAFPSGVLKDMIPVTPESAGAMVQGTSACDHLWHWHDTHANPELTARQLLSVIEGTSTHLP